MTAAPFELTAELRRYRLLHPEEAALAAEFEALLAEGDIAFRRERRAGHFTASAWVLAPESASVLLIHHRKLDRWLQPGGHADGEVDLTAVAEREVLEETAIAAEQFQGGVIFDLDIHRIPRRRQVAEHDHFDVRFLMVAPAGVTPRGNDETQDARWVPLGELERYTTDLSMLRMREKGLRRLRR